MPKKPALSKQIPQQLKQILQFQGPLKSPDLAQQLKISQASLSRILQSLQSEIITWGRTRNRHYALKKIIPLLNTAELPLYLITKKGKIQLWARLIACYPKGFYLKILLEQQSQKSKSAKVSQEISEIYFNDLPYFIEDLRPSGYLGKVLAQSFSYTEINPNPKQWNNEELLYILADSGWNLPGQILIGEKACQLYIKNKNNSNLELLTNLQPTSLKKAAEQSLSHFVSSSSIGGEQPKFLVIAKPSQTHYLVKFSPDSSNSLQQRYFDLLVCEHLAHLLLNEFQIKSCKSKIITHQKQIFLLIERFDRFTHHGRNSVFSLAALDLEFIGKYKDWITSAEVLYQKNWINLNTYKQICFLQTFGSLIANSDMHLGNLAFICDSIADFCRKAALPTKQPLLELAPVYDMLPMAFLPIAGQLPQQPTFLRPVLPSTLQTEKLAVEAALKYWQLVVDSKLISADFKNIAKQQLHKILAAKKDLF